MPKYVGGISWSKDVHAQSKFGAKKNEKIVHLETRNLKQTELQRLKKDRLRIRVKMIEQEGDPKSTRGKEKVVRNRRPPETVPGPLSKE